MRWRQSSVPSSSSMYLRMSGARRSRLMSWLIRARLTPCLRASSAAFLTSPVSINRRHSRARLRASMMRGRVARSARARGPQAWPAASGDGTQRDSPGSAGDSAWHAEPADSGPVERAPSSRCRIDDALGRLCVGSSGEGNGSRQRSRCAHDWLHDGARIMMPK